MIDCAAFYDALIARGLCFYTGVPDSLLQELCACIEDRADADSHILAANEGNAVALAAGHYLATGSPAVVYMQNSGEGNAVNPLTSLMDPLVYGIPALLIIGWRGEPGTTDEPQHRKQGEITLTLLEALGIDHAILPDDPGAATATLDTALAAMQRRPGPYALVVRKGTFEKYGRRKPEPVHGMTREQAVEAVAAAAGPRDVIVSTTGKASRELYEYRVSQGADHSGRDFLTVGSMGHASQIALGIARSQRGREVICLDGDGALIMHMGALAIIGKHAPANFSHVVVNNGAHDSVGGQATAGFGIDIPAIALACGYRSASRVGSHATLNSEMTALLASQGPALLEVQVDPGSRPDLGRPASSPGQNKDRLMAFLRS